jgi:hypothetical protein
MSSERSKKRKEVYDEDVNILDENVNAIKKNIEFC